MILERQETTPIVRDGILRSRADRPEWQEAFLPSPSVQNHAANLMVLEDGALGCVWFGGTQEGMADISVHFARLEPDALRWSEAVVLRDNPGRSEQNPILFPLSNNVLWLLYTSQISGNQDSAVVRRRISKDNGRSWSDAETMIADSGTFVRQPLLRQANGDLLLGTFLCRATPDTKWTGDDDISEMRLSSDNGATWRRIAVPDSLGAVHMNIVDAGAGELLALFRSRWADFIHAARSNDGGQSWSAPVPTTLPNNNSSIQCTRLSDGRLALVYNHSSARDATERRLSLYDEIDDGDGRVAKTPTGRSAFWGAPRAPLCLTLSADGGRSWGKPLVIADGDGYCMTNNSADRQNRELSYPSVHQTPDGALHMAFTHHRQAIRYVRIAKV